MADATPGLSHSAPLPPLPGHEGRSRAAGPASSDPASSDPASSWVLARVRQRAQRASGGGAPRPPWPSFQQALEELSGRGQHPPSGVSEAARLAWAAREMETQFLQQVWRAMRQTIPEGGLLPKNPATELFEDMLDEERSHVMAHSGQLGLARQIYESMIPYVNPDPEE